MHVRNPITITKQKKTQDSYLLHLSRKNVQVITNVSTKLIRTIYIDVNR